MTTRRKLWLGVMGLFACDGDEHTIDRTDRGGCSLRAPAS